MGYIYSGMLSTIFIPNCCLGSYVGYMDKF